MKPVAAAGEDLATSLPNVLSARTIETTLDKKRVKIGYLRIWSFDVDDHEAFVTEVRRLLQQLPADRLIVDLRANPGGLIWAAERLLQLFTDETDPADPLLPARHPGHPGNGRERRSTGSSWTPGSKA